ncbi:flagellin [Rhizobium sp. RU20A]|uniref:flagellin N-terminal helical domain-containing protein n=1 Tax=Rhizobium sp. RU20A TaxID=1907412 RepID=UPI000956AD7A|nr:hypothetical protein [Rhizobium sp. RU20A]SIQ09478.1 flagellin [Rhizobium sp. RU20A]
MTTMGISAATASALSLLNGASRVQQRQPVRATGARKISTGVSADPAGYWSATGALGAERLSLASAEDATSLSAALADSAAIGIDTARAVVGEIRKRLIQAQAESGDNKGRLDSEIERLKAQLSAVVAKAGFNGQNWLKTETHEKPGLRSIIAAVDPVGERPVVRTIDVDTARTNLIAEGDAEDGLLTRSYTGKTRTGRGFDYHLIGGISEVAASGEEIGLDRNTRIDELEGMIRAIDAMLGGLTTARTVVGSAAARVQTTTSFTQILDGMDDSGIGRLVNSDMEENSARLGAERARAALKNLGLGIANAAPRALANVMD